MHSTLPPRAALEWAGMKLPAAWQLVSPRVGELIQEWRQKNPATIAKEANVMTFLGEFGLRRSVDGTIELFGPSETGTLIKHNDFSYQIYEWLLAASYRKIQLLVLDEINRLTGRTGRDLNVLKDLAPISGRHIGEILGGLYGSISGVSDLAAEFIDYLDPEVLHLVKDAADPHTSISAYNLIAAHLPEWRSLHAQAPGLMPLVHYTCHNKHLSFARNIFQSLKRYGKQHGLTEAGWKILSKFPVQHTQLLMHLSLVDCFRVASHYGEVGEVPSLHFLRAHVAKCEDRGNFRDAIPAWFNAAALKENRRLQNIKAPEAPYFVNGSYMDAIDWLRHYLANGGQPDAHQKRAGWQWIERQSNAWHEQQARNEATTLYTWDSALGTYQDNGYDVVPLTSSEDLAAEGARMHHCVAAYAEYCHEGRSRIFSIRKNGEHLATAELVNNGLHWSLNQNRGPCNGHPGSDIIAIAFRLQDRYNAATSSK